MERQYIEHDQQYPHRLTIKSRLPSKSLVDRKKAAVSYYYEYISMLNHILAPKRVEMIE